MAIIMVIMIMVFIKINIVFILNRNVIKHNINGSNRTIGHHMEDINFDIFSYSYFFYFRMMEFIVCFTISFCLLFIMVIYILFRIFFFCLCWYVFMLFILLFLFYTWHDYQDDTVLCYIMPCFSLSWFVYIYWCRD
ncbi:unnamed protein product (mitochondrion) [Kudoa iwatai]|uniref:NADH dehydrogenase subunit 3 n=1 Tax=Kudoa iwatai TaxID=269814 RepID=A0A1R3UIH8_9CNID|nr:unnamed protein product [Kudoa iwatai]